MKKDINKIENSLIVPEKESLFTRFCKWVSNFFGKKEQKIWSEEPVAVEAPSITIPKAVKMPMQIEEPEELDENSLEYLYKLSDEELDDLDKLYDVQMEEAKNEFAKLENILKTYEDSIKKLQGKIAEENV